MVGPGVDTVQGCNPRTSWKRWTTPPATSIAARSRLSDTQHVQPDSLPGCDCTTALLRGSQGEQQVAREGAHLVRAAVESGESHSQVTCAGSLPHGAGNNPSIKPAARRQANWESQVVGGVGSRTLQRPPPVRGIHHILAVHICVHTVEHCIGAVANPLLSHSPRDIWILGVSAAGIASTLRAFAGIGNFPVRRIGIIG